MTGTRRATALLVCLTLAGAGCDRISLSPRRSLLSRLLGRGVDPAFIAEKNRAVSIPVPEYDLLSVRPGDRVDVLVVFDARAADGAQKKLAATVLQNVKVLGVTLSGDLKGTGALQIMVNPYGAQYAALAAAQGELSIALRRDGDADIYPMEMSGFDHFFR
jgi:Flp pilus assembly protein CpaB